MPTISRAAALLPVVLAVAHHLHAAQPVTGLKTRLETPRFDETVAFYTEHLGMTVLSSWDEEGDKGVILGLGAAAAEAEAFLEIAPASQPRRYEGVSLQFRVRDLEAMIERLRGRVAFRGPDERPWGSTYLYLEDPTGVQVIVYEGEL